MGCLHCAEVSGLPHKLLYSSTPDLCDAAQVMDASPMAFQSLSRRRRFSRQRVLENVLVYQNRLVTFHIPPLHCLLERTRKVTLNQGSDVSPLQCPDSLYCYPGTHSTTRIMPLGCLTWGGAGAYENSGGGTLKIKRSKCEEEFVSAPDLGRAFNSALYDRRSEAPDTINALKRHSD